MSSSNLTGGQITITGGCGGCASGTGGNFVINGGTGFVVAPDFPKHHYVAIRVNNIIHVYDNRVPVPNTICGLDSNVTILNRPPIVGQYRGDYRPDIFSGIDHNSKDSGWVSCPVCKSEYEDMRAVEAVVEG